MNYQELSPAEAVKRCLDGLGAREPWCVRWDRLDTEERAAVARTLPSPVVTKTSGSTGQQRAWSRTPAQLLSETAQLAALWQDRRVDMVLASAPPAHFYGLLTTLLLPLRLGVPVYYMPDFHAALPDVTGRGVGVTAIPWTFRILSRSLDALASAAEISVLHSTAKLPLEASEFVAGLDTVDVAITEIFGSTETGGIASRRLPAAEWTLFDDVTLEHDGVGEVPLVVSGPRLADGLHRWQTDDSIDMVGGRKFLFLGRRTRLRKINGVRVNLDEVEELLRAAAPCADLACVPIDDPLRGESFSVLAVPVEPARDDLVSRVRIAAKSLRLAPHEVRIVARIDRSETGKLRG